MNTIALIAQAIIETGLVLFIVKLLVSETKALWSENEMTDEISNWFFHTSIGGWYLNKKNGVEMISEEEFNNLVKKYNNNIVINL